MKEPRRARERELWGEPEKDFREGCGGSESKKKKSVAERKGLVAQRKEEKKNPLSDLGGKNPKQNDRRCRRMKNDEVRLGLIGILSVD